MRGLSAFVGFIAIILAMAPTTVIMVQHVHDVSDVSWTPVFITAPIAIIGFLLCRTLRASASKRYVEVSIRRRQAGWSPTFAYTLVAWLLAGCAGGILGATIIFAQTAKGPIEKGSYRDGLSHYPLPVLFLFAGLALLGAAGYYAWIFRRRYEIPLLEAAGVVILVEPVEKLPKAEAVKLRSVMWLRGTVIDGLLFASAILPRLLPGGDRPSGEELAKGAFTVVGGPAFISFALLLVMLLLWPTRRSAFEALRRPSSLSAIAIVLLGFTVDAAGQGTAGGIIALVGVIIGSATCLNIMDRGAQPWLGFIFLAGNYIFGYLTAPNGDSALPQGVVGWLIAILAAGYAVKEARSHWRDWTKLEQPTDRIIPPAI